MIAARTTTTPTVCELTHRFQPVFERYNILRAILFGSHARGDASRRSDIDLILLQETSKRFLDRYDGLLHDLTAASPGPAVDVLVYTPAEWEQLQDRPFLQHAVRDGVILYERLESPTHR